MKHPVRKLANLLLAATPVLSLAAGLEWKDLGDGRLQLLDHGKPAFVYNYGPQLAEGAPADRRRSAYIYPLYTPAGVSVTDDFPKDHYHHRGLFWGWPVVETANGERYDLWMMRNGIETRHERFSAQSSTTKEAILNIENAWYAGGEKLVKETVHIKAFPAKSGTRTLEVALTLEALTGPVTIKGSQEKGKSYGGLSVRFAPREQTRITADTGAVEKDEDLVNHAWAALDAVYNGKRATLRIDSDPKNPGGPPQWCLRKYGFIGASFPGQAGTTLEKGKPVTLRYTVILKDLEPQS